LSIDRDTKSCSNDDVHRFVKQYVDRIEVERESVDELIYGIKRGQANQVEALIDMLEQDRTALGIKSYSLSMATIEDVFLRWANADGAVRSELTDAFRLD
jgi:hypothetical protein